MVIRKENINIDKSSFIVIHNKFNDNKYNVVLHINCNIINRVQ